MVSTAEWRLFIIAEAKQNKAKMMNKQGRTKNVHTVHKKNTSKSWLLVTRSSASAPDKQ